MKVIVNGLATEYTDEGAGPTILMLHGWAVTHHDFDTVAKALPGFRIVRVDLPGFGGTEAPREAWHVADYARFIKAFTEKIGLTSYVLAGHSFGGRVSLRGVAEKIVQPSKLILIASAGIAKNRTFRNRAMTVVAKIGKILTTIPPLSFWRFQMRSFLYRKLKSDYLAAGRLTDIYLNSIREDLREAAKKVSIPTLLIWGSEDDMTPLKDGKLFSELIQGSRIEILPGVGHFVHNERPQEVAEIIKKFV